MTRLAPIRALRAVPEALGGLALGLMPQLLVYLALPYVHHLYALLFAAYASLFASLALLSIGATLATRLGRARPYRPGLRQALIVEAAALSAVWYVMLNPFPVGPLIANAQYLPALLIAAVLLMAWLFFLFILKRML